jgi:hypothetical protein
MKFYLFIILTISSIATQAQGLYFGGSFGYGFAGNNGPNTYEGLPEYGSEWHSHFSNGVVSVSSGYFFTKNIGAEMGVGYFKGTKTESSKDGGLGGGSKTNSTHMVKSFYLNPSFVVRANEGKVVPHGEIGVFLGMINHGNYEDIKNVYDNTGKSLAFGGNSHSDNTITYKAGISIGVTAAFGVDFMLSDRLAVMGELFFRTAEWTPKKYTGTEALTNNATYQQTLTTTYSNANYHGSGLSPLSAVGLNVGVKYYLLKNN